VAPAGAALLLEAVLIAGVGFLPIAIEPAVLIVAFAMGLQASAITHFGGNAISTVVVTSTLARTAEATLDRMLPAISGHRPRSARRACWSSPGSAIWSERWSGRCS
jgi:uncharacterized membrane protein YoaK (UPF0700 family)